MPIKVGPDPNNPGGFIWVDAVTGEPAVQPGGPETPFVAPSDLSPEQRQQLGLPPAAEAQTQAAAPQPQPVGGGGGGAVPTPGTRTLSQILADVGRSAWNASPPTQETELKLNSTTLQYERTPTGNYLVNINDGRGHNQVVKVTPAMQQVAGGGGVPGAPADVPIGGDNWVLAEAPTNLPAGSEAKTVTAWDGSIWSPDANGTWQPVVPGKAPNMDEAQLKAIEAQVANIRRDELNRNLSAHGVSVTDEQWATIEATRRARTVDEQALQEKIREWEAENGRAEATTAAQIGLTGAQTEQARAAAQATTARVPSQNELDNAQADLTRANAAAKRATTPFETELAQQNVRLAQANVDRLRAEISKVPSEIGLTQAQTRYQDASSDYQAAQAERARALLPSDIATAEANIEAARVKMEQARQEMARPVAYPVSTEAAIRSYIAPSGEIVDQPNLAFQPKTQFDVATRVGQLQSMAQQQRDLLAAQISSGTITQDQANTQFERWWQQNVQPQQEALGQATTQIAREQERLDMARREAAVTAAQGAGTQAISAFQAEAPYLAGAGYGGAMATALNALGQGREVPEGTFRPEMFTAPPVNLQQQARDATMEALKLISPTAAAATGTPLPQLGGLDIGAMLNQTAYGSTQPQAWGGTPQPQQQGQAQQPITINIGGAQQPQQQQQPSVPESFLPRAGSFPPAFGGTPYMPPQFTPAAPAAAGAFAGAVPGAPTAPPQFTPAAGASGNVVAQTPYDQILEQFRRARRPTFPSAFPGSPTAPSQFTPIWPAYAPNF
jgi:hypothetical protein